MSRERDRLTARIRQFRHPAPADDPTRAQTTAADPEPALDVTQRVAHLEQMIQGLQDSIYREAQRQETRLTELEARTEPAALAAALSKDARERGL